jgi:hypothetical protein
MRDDYDLRFAGDEMSLPVELEKGTGTAMNELISQIAQKTGIGEDKAREAAEVVISFLKTKVPGIGTHLDGALQTEAGEKVGGISEKVRDAVGGVFGKKTA